MKKRHNILQLLLLSIAFLQSIIPISVSALPDEKFYLPERNTYYTRTQHTYSFYESADIYHDEYVSAVYTLLKDLDEAQKTSIWDFSSKYTVPWKAYSGYDIAYCADVPINIEESVPYNKVEISKSTYIDNSIKSNLIGILKNSYPFITEAEMISRLLKEGILEYRTVDGKQVVTAKGNPEPTRNINADEFLSATQMAIYHFSNPGVIDKIYFNTYMVSARTVLKSAGLWTGTYDTKGVYEEARYNIQVVYDYLINLKSHTPETTKIESMYFDKDNINIKMNNIVTPNSNLKFEIYDNGTLIKELTLKDLTNDYADNFSIDRSQMSFQNLKVRISGNESLENEAVVYEAEGGKTVSQTLLGLSTVERPIDLNASFQALDIQKYSSKQEVIPGEIFNYTVHVDNPNDFAVQKIVVTDIIPDELEIVSSDGIVNNNIVSWTFDLNPKENKDLMIKVKVKENLNKGEIVNRSTINYTGEEKTSNDVMVKIFINPNTGIMMYTWKMFIVLAVAVVVLSKSRKIKQLIVYK